MPDKELDALIDEAKHCIPEEALVLELKRVLWDASRSDNLVDIQSNLSRVHFYRLALGLEFDDAMATVEAKKLLWVFKEGNGEDE